MLNIKLINEIKALYKSGVDIHSISNKYNIPLITISDAINYNVKKSKRIMFLKKNNI